MAYEKGLSLELALADLFKKRGYNVVHNLKKVGRSGVQHQIDIYAEYKAPLHTSTLIIEAKSYCETIDKDKVKKFIQILQDLGIDRGIFVTTSDFTPSALMIARQYRKIELWNRDKLTKHVGELQLSISEQSDTSQNLDIRARTVAPRISRQQASQYATEQSEKRNKGGLFGTGKVLERVAAVKLIDILNGIYSIAYSWLIQNFMNPFVSLARGFELGIIVLASVIFILITVFVVLRQAKKLPKSYKIQIIDVFGHEDPNSGLRQSFHTHEAAESYAREYRTLYGESSKFRVVGIR